MIKCVKGSVTLAGERGEIMAEFGTIVHSLHNNMNLSNEGILRLVKLGLLSNDELDKKLAELE